MLLLLNSDFETAACCYAILKASALSKYLNWIQYTDPTFDFSSPMPCLRLSCNCHFQWAVRNRRLHTFTTTHCLFDLRTAIKAPEKSETARSLIIQKKNKKILVGKMILLKTTFYSESTEIGGPKYFT